MKRILIDGRFIGVGESMTRYTLEILRGILALDRENEYTLLVRPVGVKVLEEWLGCKLSAPNAKQKSKDQNDKNLDIKSFKLSFDIRHSDFDIKVLDIPHYSLGEQTKLLNYLNRERFDLVHFIQFNHPIRYKRPFIVTVHDLTLVGYLHRTNPIKKLAFSKVMTSAVQDSKKIIAVSKFSKQEIVDYYRVDPKKIEVVYNGLDHTRYNSRITDHVAGEEGGLSRLVGTVPGSERERRIECFKEKHGIAGSYLLYTGAWKKHKNLVKLLQAYEKYLSDFSLLERGRLRGGMICPIQLVLAGKVDKNEPEVIAEVKRINSLLKSKFKNRNSIVTTGYIKESDLPTVYAAAMAYIIPSLSEGFGLPPLEALACGTPVISSNASCMPEILGDAPLYFDPYDVDDIAAVIERVVDDEALRQKLIRKGLEQAKKYNWDKTARKTLEIYRSALGGI